MIPEANDTVKSDAASGAWRYQNKLGRWVKLLTGSAKKIWLRV
jgi:hypothetical protein